VAKVALGPQTLIYPMPTLLVGANVNDKPNFMTVAWGGIACSEPPMISVGIRHVRYTLKGIHQNNTFSVNIPSIEMVKEVDYCGTESGAKSDKVDICKLKVFYGKLMNAPLIDQCPVNLECKVMHILDLGSHSLIVGKIEETYVSESCLTNGQPDIAKINPLIFAPAAGRNYRAIGEIVAKAFSAGLELKPKK
jgi:flavin reductase (DIM6/NTAB) family NADH-FMN oxidoreductase RutF